MIKCLGQCDTRKIKQTLQILVAKGRAYSINLSPTLSDRKRNTSRQPGSWELGVNREQLIVNTMPAYWVGSTLSYSSRHPLNGILSIQECIFYMETTSKFPMYMNITRSLHPSHWPIQHMDKLFLDPVEQVQCSSTIIQPTITVPIIV